MQAERRSIWIIICLLAIAGLWQLSRDIYITPWSLNTITFAPLAYFLSLFMNSAGLCGLASALVYAILHYQRKHLTLWLMALQMMILLIVSFYPLMKGTFVLLAWMILLSVISRSKKKKKRQLQDDLLDDL